MRASMYSPLWCRFSHIRPQLHAHVSVRQHDTPDPSWYTLVNGTTGQQCRINWQAYQFIGRCDGKHTIQEVWDSLVKILSDNTPTQEVVIALLTELDRHGFLHHEVRADDTYRFLRKQGKTGAPAWRTKLTWPSAMVATVLCFVPIPFNTMAQGVVWVPEQTRIRPGAAGLVKEIRARPGESVEAGQVLVILEDPVLELERKNLDQQLAALRTRQLNSRLQDPSRTGTLSHQMMEVSAKLQRVDERMACLQVRSPGNGVLVMPHQDDLTGTLVEKNAMLGYVLDRESFLVRAELAESDAALVRAHLTGVKVKMAEHPDETMPAQLVQGIPVAAGILPSAASENRGGSGSRTEASSLNGLASSEPVVLVDLKLPGTILEHVGSQASVRFELGTQPVYRRLFQTVLRHFNSTNG